MKGFYILLLSFLLLGFCTAGSKRGNGVKDKDKDDSRGSKGKKDNKPCPPKNPKCRGDEDDNHDKDDHHDKDDEDDEDDKDDKYPPSTSKRSTTTEIPKSTIVTTTTETPKSTIVTSATETATRRKMVSIFVPLSVFLFLMVLTAFILWRYWFQCWRKLTRKGEDTVKMTAGSNGVTIYATAGHSQGSEDPVQLPQPGHIYQEISDAHVRVPGPDSSNPTAGLPFQDQKAADQQAAQGQYSLLGQPTSDIQQEDHL